MTWFLFYIKLPQTALKLPLFEKFLPPQCDRACVVPVKVLVRKKAFSRNVTNTICENYLWLRRLIFLYSYCSKMFSKTY